jgi:hypothetical protein
MTTTSEKVDPSGDIATKDGPKEDKTKPSGLKSYLVSMLLLLECELTPDILNHSVSLDTPTTSQDFFTQCLLLPPSQLAPLYQ